MKTVSNGAGCLHCGKARQKRRKGPGRVWFRRGLCWACYNDRAIRAAYPPVSAHGKKYYEDPKQERRRGRRLPKTPSSYLPGTAEHEEVLAGRARRGECLHHPGDARLDRADQPPIAELLPPGVHARDLPLRLPPPRRLSA